MFVFPDAEPFDQILGALQFGMKTILLPFEPSHVLHRHTESARKHEKTKKNREIRKLKNLILIIKYKKQLFT